MQVFIGESEVIILYLDFKSKMNLFLTSKKYNFIRSYIYDIPLTYSNGINNRNIRKFNNLNTLFIKNCKMITDCSIKDLIYLRKLHIQHGRMITDYGIKNLTKLQSLYISNNNLISNVSINKLINLECLRLKNNNIISNIDNLTRLTRLEILNTDVMDKYYTNNSIQFSNTNKKNVVVIGNFKIVFIYN